VTVFENNEFRTAGKTAEIKNKSVMKVASVPGIICDWSLLFVRRETIAHI